MRILIALTILLISEANAAGPVFGRCPDSPVLADFDPTRYVGKWYEIERREQSFEERLKCVTATYSLKDATSITVKNVGIDFETKVESVIEGTASVIDLKEPNKLSLKLTNTPTGKYDVWATDYDNYALVYSCSQIIPLVLKLEQMWILGRQPTLESSTVAYLKDLFKNGKVDYKKLEPVAQDC